MSVLVKGMKMPTSCYNCACHDHRYNECQAEDARELYGESSYTRRPDWCPLVEVPPHGRLIDADALLNLLNKCMFPSDMVTTTAVSMGINWIKEAPTVIEAEDGE